MSTRPIEESGDSDLIGSVAAMERAAERAWRVARETATKVVVEMDGKIVHLDPETPRPTLRDDPDATGLMPEA